MLFAIEWSIPSDKRVECYKNFCGMTPADDAADCGSDIQIVGRWHKAGGASGICIAESATSEALASWMLNWSPVCDIQVTPVVPDATQRRCLAEKPYC